MNTLNGVHGKVDRDEWYTRYEDVKRELDNYDFSGYKIVCPCDGEHSAFVKYCKDKGYDFDYFEGDYESVNYDNYDVVLTNPPFKNYQKFYNLIKDKLFVVVAPLTVSYKSWFDYKRVSVGRCKISEFTRPNGEIEKLGNVIWITNIKTGEGKPLPLCDTLEHVRTLDDGSLEVCKKSHIPNVKGKYYVPITLFEHTPLPDNINILDVKNDCKLNGKKLYTRYLIEVI